MAASNWDQRYLEGSDRWELGRPAPPLEAFLRTDSRAPQPPGRVLVPGCGRGHEAALLADLGYEVIGLDFSSEAIQRAQSLHGSDRAQLRWRLPESPPAACRGCLSTPASAPLIQPSASPISTPWRGCLPPVAGCLVCSGATGGRMAPPGAATRRCWRSSWRRPDSANSSGSRRRDQPPSATTSGWGSGASLLAPNHQELGKLQPPAIKQILTI